LREQRQEREQRHVERALSIGVDTPVEDGAGRLFEAALARRLLRERLDDVDADDRLLGDGGDVGKLLLHVAQDRVRDAAVAVGGDDDERRDRQRDQRQPPLVDEEDDRNADDGDDVLREEDQPVAEEEADVLQVDRGPRHQLSRLVTVVEAEGQADELRVEGVAHVVLDAERLPARDEAASDHEQRFEGADGEDHPDLDSKRRRVAGAAELVDYDAGEHQDRDCGSLRGDRERARDRERRSVGSKEPEQADEGEQVRTPSGHLFRQRSSFPSISVNAWA